MSHPLLAAEAGVRHLLLGNEAIVRGALEAGINVVTCYPGTPSSEIPDTFHYLASCGRYRMEYSVNEKVAVEVGAGAALAGAMSMTTMKHVGVNVAADPLFTAAYVGLPGGFVLVSADDPLCHSSQDEQDNRTYARFMGMPCFEPATAQEAKDMTREALLLARELQQPVMLRTTTRVNHLRGPVTFGALGEPAPIVPFERNPMRFVPVPAVAQSRHKVLVEHLENARAKAEASPWNKVSGEGRIGVVASGISRAYLADALAENGWEKEVKVLELGFTWPLPENLLADFMSGCDTVLVLEELQPLVEQDLRALAQERKIDVSIVGKGPDLTIFGEYSTGAVARALAHSPKLVIADEPTGNIDPELSLEMMELLERVSQTGITVLVVTHEHELVHRFHQRVVTLKNGRIISDIPADPEAIAARSAELNAWKELTEPVDDKPDEQNDETKEKEAATV